MVFIACGVLTSCERAALPLNPEGIIAIEKSALDRWGKGDPQGYLETYAPEITYFDPAREKRADGIQAMKDYYAPIAGKIKVDRYEMIDTKVQQLGDAAVLSYQLISHAIMPDGSPFTARWNSTKVYRLFGKDWKLVHDHWSFIKPELRNPPPGPQ
ncbi:MAG: nuclear transport factor 2 family protein [Acidobacteria bacterium]|nr:nuclear transport factor 2 family protein [Acidobacteriota bacterium]